MAFKKKPTETLRMACEYYENPNGIKILKSCRSCVNCSIKRVWNKSIESFNPVCSVYHFGADASSCCAKWYPCDNVKRAGCSDGQISKYSSRYEALTAWVENQLRIVEKMKKGRDTIDEVTAQDVRSIMEKIDEVREVMESIPEEERKFTNKETQVAVRKSNVVEDENMEDALMAAAREFCKSCQPKRKGGRLVRKKWPGGKRVEQISLPKERRKDKDAPATIRLDYHEITIWEP